MKVTSRPSASGKGRAVAKPTSHRGHDIAGVLLIALGIITLISLLIPDTGVLGAALHGFFQTVFGKAAWSMPFFLIILGAGYISGKKAVGITHLTWGRTLIFLAVVGIMAQPGSAGDYFDPTAITQSGGYLGAIVGWAISSLLGQAKLVGLGAIGMVGLILCVDTPIRTMLESAKNTAVDVRNKTLTRGATKKDSKIARRALVQMDEDEPKSRRPLPDEADSEIDERQQKLKKMPVFRNSNETTAASGPTLSTTTQKEGYELPPVSLLAVPKEKPKRSQQEMQKNIETLEGTLEEFGIDANVVEVATGPTVTRYEIQLGPGIRVARITSLADNIAMNLAASQVRVEAPIPGKAAIGVEVPNSAPTPVSIKELVDTKEFKDNPSRLIIALGQDVSGTNKYADLTKMPHLLIGGATNSGKSIGLASLITSLLMRNTPKDVRLVMIDPKRVELTLFDRIPHLMCPVIKDVKEAPGVLRAVWREMDRRYDVLSENGMRNIQAWNDQASFQDRMPYIVVIIDELADLMIQAAAEVETSIVRLAQLARAVGIHLVIATQRPSVDVITGTIKANIPSRMAFAVSSQIDSRTILDQKGAEDLIGKGDMLFMPIDASKPLRVQGCYVSEKEIEAICKFWREQETPVFTIDPAAENASDSKKESGDFGSEDTDPLWEESITWVVERGQASTSMLQRRFSIGFQRASRLLDTMEERGIVGPRDGPRPRDVLMSLADLDAMTGKAPQYETGWVGDE
ncbi:MAG: DNA translocase FtsK 4TM domain-containing protein [Fimbriimonadaceae bacterium]|nr:DNA translocase FtsK 4TM domain-containing protein [Fimbriimonadaceae bacterium]